jgi:decaprenylphospho-beta-D-erythro-pentofuranosid-2-ulose 2-reductase
MTEGSVLILGARSDIGLAVAHRFAKCGHPVQLAARNATTLEADRTDIALRYNVRVTAHEFDALATGTHGQFVDELPELPQIAVCSVGVLGVQAKGERDIATAVHLMRSNYEGPAVIMEVLANRFEARGSGTLIGISSVAGERGRASNYIYGSAKAGFTAYLSGLRNRLARKGVHVVTVLPGFVRTRMTEGLSLPPMLTSTPEDIAELIFAAASKGVDITYAGLKWSLLMLIIKSLPETVFKRLSI